MSNLLSLFIIVLVSFQAWFTPVHDPQAVQTPTAPVAAGYTVRYHPDGPLQSGDLVSFDIFSPSGIDLNNQTVQVQVLDPEVKDLGSAKFYPASGERYRAILQWAWDTQNLPAGNYNLQFTISGKNQTWRETVDLLPPDPNRKMYQWETVDTKCCSIHYITGTDAAKDIDQLALIIQQQADMAASQLGAELKERININLLPRMLGQGGFANDEVYISYSHENYVHHDFALLVHHEITHRIDAEFKADLRPSLLVEGLAVYESGGHYKPEPILLRAASLVTTQQYIPLDYLIDHFYPAQHEKGYIEGGALIDYMIKRWGSDAYFAFYRDIHNQSDGKQSSAVDAALKAHFGLSLKLLESQFIGYLENLPDVLDERQDMQGTIDLYDTIRSYQKQLDPSAYFEQVWLPDAKQMRERGIVADYLRGPEQPFNLEVESLLYSAGQKLGKGDYSGMQSELSKVNDLLREISHPQGIVVLN